MMGQVDTARFYCRHYLIQDLNDMEVIPAVSQCNSVTESHTACELGLGGAAPELLGMGPLSGQGL